MCRLQSQATSQTHQSIDQPAVLLSQSAFIFRLIERSIAMTSVPCFINCLWSNLAGSMGFSKIRLAPLCNASNDVGRLNFREPKMKSMSCVFSPCLPKYKYCSLNGSTKRS